MRSFLMAGAGAAVILSLGPGLAAAQDEAANDILAEASAANSVEADAEAGIEASFDAEAAKSNPLLAEWSGAYGGVPPFEAVEVADFQFALERGMELTLADIDAIASNPEPATFENTIAALERSRAELDRVAAVYGVWSSNMSSPEFREVESTMAPRLSAFEDRIVQNTELFARIEAVYESPAMEKMTAGQRRLVWDYYTDFVRAGADLKEEDKSRIAAINERLATLYTDFSNNLLHDEQEYVTWLGEDDLEGLSDSVIDAAAAAAAEREREDEYAILNTRSSMDPFLNYSGDRALREEVWRTYYSRGDNGGEWDNNDIISEILALRGERSALLGYDTYADWALEKQVAETPAAAMTLMMQVWPAARARVAEEVADMQAIADAEGADVTIEPWDYRYYSEKVRHATYDYDANEVQEYLQLEKLREGMFWMADQLYGFEFATVDDVRVYHPDVRVWEVTRGGKHAGLWYFDPYAREGKRSGAWMNAYRVQESMDGKVTPIVSNNANFVKGAPGEPVLISWSDAETLFHEFGHAIHGLSSHVAYPSLAGTAVPRDYVEFPSQVHEQWLLTPEILNRFALHHETGEPIPAKLVDKIREAATFNQGFLTTEYLASALVDTKLHTLKDPGDLDPDAFERKTLAELRMPDELPMRHRLPQFAHIFAGEGYAAGYYSYLWADAFSTDAWERFLEEEGPWDDEVAADFYEYVLSAGNTIDPKIAYRRFRGRDLKTDALMRDRGFALPDEAPAVGSPVKSPGETAQ